MSQLTSNPIFAGLSPEQHAELARVAVLRSYAHGETILAEGEQTGTLLVVEQGRARVVKSASAAGQQFELSVLQAGESIGEIRLADSQPASATVMADGPVTVWCYDLRHVLDDPDQLALRSSLLANLARVLARRLRRNSEVAVEAMQAELEQARARASAGRFIVALVAVTSACILGIAALQELAPSHRPSQTWISAASIIIGGLCMYRFLKRSPYKLPSFGLTLKGWRTAAGEAVLYTLPVLGVLTAVKAIWIHYDPVLRGEPLLHPGAMFGAAPFNLGTYLLALLIYAVLSPVQEFFYRAGMQGSLHKLMPSVDGKTSWRPILIANLVFASVHGYIGFRFAVVVFVPGLLWGWLYDRQRSLVGASISHILIGTMALFVLGLQVIVGGH